MTPAFAEAATRTCQALRARWRNRKHEADWMATLETTRFRSSVLRVCTGFGGKKAHRVLTRIWTGKPETARRVCQRIQAVLRWMWAHGYVSEDVAGQGIDGALARHAGRQAAPPGTAVPRRGGGARSRGEVTGEQGGETLPSLPDPDGCSVGGGARGAIATDGGEWRIRGERTKTRSPYRVTLSAGVIAVLERARARDDRSALGFPGRQCGRRSSRT